MASLQLCCTDGVAPPLFPALAGQAEAARAGHEPQMHKQPQKQAPPGRCSISWSDDSNDEGAFRPRQQVLAPALGRPHEQQEQTDFLNRDFMAALVAIYTSLAKMAGDSQCASRFHAKREPGISVADYLDRVQKYFFCSDACFIVSLVYIDRIVKIHPDFTISKLSLHRVLAASLVVSAKFLDDAYYNNAYYGKVCGISLKELNSLEIAFVTMLDWKLDVSTKEFNEYLAHVQKLLQGPEVVIGGADLQDDLVA